MKTKKIFGLFGMMAYICFIKNFDLRLWRQVILTIYWVWVCNTIFVDMPLPTTTPWKNWANSNTPTSNHFNFFIKKWTYSEGEKYFDILKEIATENGKNYVYPSKNGVFYHQRYIDEEGFEKEIDWSQVLNNAKPNTIIKVLKRHHIKPIIRYPMIGSTDILGYNKVYNEALCVLDEKLVKILNVEQIK